MKIVRVEIVAEIEVDPCWYKDDLTDAIDEEIIEAEKENFQDWIVDHIISEKVSVRDKK